MSPMTFSVERWSFSMLTPLAVQADEKLFCTQKHGAMQVENLMDYG